MKDKENMQVVLDAITKHGICGVSESFLDKLFRRSLLSKYLNTLRSENKIFHDLTDGKWKLVEFKIKRKEGPDLEWCSS